VVLFCSEGQRVMVKVTTRSNVKKFGTACLWKYNRSEIETLLLGKVLWEVGQIVTHLIFDFDCLKDTA